MIGALSLTFVGTQEASAARIQTTAKQRALAAKVATAKVGAQYSWGAIGPRSFDCSGLVGFAYKKARHPLKARTTYQLAKLGMRISPKRLKRGDLVFTYSRSLGHVGIYLGRGRYVHAPGAGRRVEIAALPGGSALVRAVRP
ncbi:MAG: hypothetical protein JWO69_854 [Thermoleophilia bacterium]|nr:hypothetical protein [Thermoleophilia bacterium]